MEDGEWGEPLLKDCLFSDILDGGRKSPDLPALPDSLLRPDPFATFDDLSAIPTSTLFGTPSTHHILSSNPHYWPPDPTLTPARQSGFGGGATLPTTEEGREQKLSPGGSETSYASSSGRLPSPPSNPLLHHYAPPPSIPVKQEFPEHHGTEGGPWSSESGSGVLGTPYSEGALSGPVSGSGSLRLLSSGGHQPRPRLLIAALPSSLVRRKGQAQSLSTTTAPIGITQDARCEASPSPPSSDGSLGELGSGGALGPLRNRSKMHELAVRQRLITEQDPRATGGEVSLSPEERRTLLQEGYPIPAKLPLNKQEEESLKIVRRKIKNKLSAQESRRKRKEYMESLEQRVQTYHSENATLRQRLRQLEASNRTLGGQLKKVQGMVSSGSGTNGGSGNSSSGNSGGTANISIATQTSVCLTALVLLFAVAMPVLPAQLLPPGLGLESPSVLYSSAFPNLPTAPPSPPVTRPSRTLSDGGEDEAGHCERQSPFPQTAYPEAPDAGGFLHHQPKDSVRGSQEELWEAASVPGLGGEVREIPITGSVGVTGAEAAGGDEHHRNLSTHCPTCPPANPA